MPSLCEAPLFPVPSFFRLLPSFFSLLSTISYDHTKPTKPLLFCTKRVSSQKLPTSSESWLSLSPPQPPHACPREVPNHTFVVAIQWNIQGSDALLCRHVQLSRRGASLLLLLAALLLGHPPDRLCAVVVVESLGPVGAQVQEARHSDALSRMASGEARGVRSLARGRRT